MQLPRIKHEFPKQSLRYKLITTLNITPNETIEVAKNQSQQNLINLARANIVNGYSATNCNLLSAMFVLNNVILHMHQNSCYNKCRYMFSIFIIYSKLGYIIYFLLCLISYLFM